MNHAGDHDRAPHVALLQGNRKGQGLSSLGLLPRLQCFVPEAQPAPGLFMDHPPATEVYACTCTEPEMSK